MNLLRRTNAGRRLILLSLCFVLAAGSAAAVTFPTIVREPARGVLLVANPALSDPNFAHTVVLITDHGILGSVGLVLNRKSESSVVASLPGLADLEDADITLRYGGPVGMNSIRLLVRSEHPIDATDQLLDGVYFVNTSALLRELLANTHGRDERVTIHYYAGFAAWSRGQLAAEIARGDWYLVKGDAATIFATDAAQLWQELVETLAGLWVLVEN
jgi:putative transcriptional regulator